jgi:hypothetical protein
MQTRSLKSKPDTAYKGVIGKILDHLFTYHPDEEYFKEAQAGEPVYDSVLDQVNAARDSALDMKKRFNDIDISDDPQSAAILKRELQQLQLESNRYRRVAQAPDQRPSFWRYLLHPWYNPQSRDQITTDMLDERRLRASSVRDDLNMINMQAGILQDIAKDVNLDTNFDLKSFGVKANLKDSVEDIKKYLDIMIGTLNKTSRDLTQAGKSIKTMKNVNTIKTNDREEKATVDAALKYYKAMKDTMQDIVITKPSSKLFGLGGNNISSQELDPNVLSDLMDNNKQAEDGLTLQDAVEIKPAAYDQMGDQLDHVASLAEQLMRSLPDDQSQLTEQSVNASQQLNQAMDNLNRVSEGMNNSGAVDPYNADQAQDVVDDGQEFLQDFSDLGDFVPSQISGDAYNSYRSVSTKKIDLKKKKAQLAALVGKLKKAAQKFKKKKRAAEVVQKQAAHAKAILTKKTK